MIAIGVLDSSASYISGALLDKSPAAAVEASGHELNIKAFFIEDKVLCKLCSYSVIFCVSYMVVSAGAGDQSPVSGSIITEKSPMGIQEAGSSRRTF
jgi:hypothetical protein